MLCQKNYNALIYYFFSGIYADGPGAYLFHGVVEQQYIFHVMDHALCLSGSKQSSCDQHMARKEEHPKSNKGTGIYSAPVLLSLLSVAVAILDL